MREARNPGKIPLANVSGWDWVWQDKSRFGPQRRDTIQHIVQEYFAGESASHGLLDQASADHLFPQFWKIRGTGTGSRPMVIRPRIGEVENKRDTVLSGEPCSQRIDVRGKTSGLDEIRNQFVLAQCWQK